MELIRGLLLWDEQSWVGRESTLGAWNAMADGVLPGTLWGYRGYTCSERLRVGPHRLMSLFFSTDWEDSAKGDNCIGWDTEHDHSWGELRESWTQGVKSRGCCCVSSDQVIPTLWALAPCVVIGRVCEIIWQSIWNVALIESKCNWCLEGESCIASMTTRTSSPTSSLLRNDVDMVSQVLE